VARKRDQEAETLIVFEQEDMRNAEKSPSTTRKPDKTFQAMLNAIRDSLSNLSNSDDHEDGEDEQDNEADIELGNLIEDNEHGFEMGAFARTGVHWIESIWQTPITLDEPTQSGCWDLADYFRERDEKNGRSELIVLAVVKRQTDTTAA